VIFSNARCRTKISHNNLRRNLSSNRVNSQSGDRRDGYLRKIPIGSEGERPVQPRNQIHSGKKNQAKNNDASDEHKNLNDPEAFGFSLNVPSLSLMGSKY